METSPGWCSHWFVSEDHIETTLKDIEENNVDLKTVFIVPSFSMKNYYMITWKNLSKEKKIV